MKIESVSTHRMEVQHFTGKVMANVQYWSVGGDINLISIKAPATGWELTTSDGITAMEAVRIRKAIKELS